jgi:predicted dehydrogenase
MTVRLAVVGAGVMGANHVRIAKSLPEVDFVGVVDADEDRARAAAGDAGAFRSVAELVESTDTQAVVLAVPTALHAELTHESLDAGLHVLVEKPIAASVDEAREMVAAADRAGRYLMVGHVERFNPVIIECVKYLDDPLHIDIDRVGPFSARVQDNVVADLMIHDLDLVTALANSTVVDVSGVGRRVHTDAIDMASVHLRFETGLTATLTASRIGQQKVRQVGVTQRESFIGIDLLRQDISLHRMAHMEYLAEGGTRYRQTSVVEIPFVETRGEPLALEQREFVTAITEHRPPLVTGAQGARALELVGRVLDAIRVS